MQEIQQKFSFPDDGHGNPSRSTHQFSLVNNGNTNKVLTSLSFDCNVDIEEPWGVLGQQWASVKKVKNPDNLTYNYTLNLTSPITLKANSTTLLLEYGVTKALGPLVDKNNNPVGMPPKNVEVNSLPVTDFYSNNPQTNPNPNKELDEYHANWGQYQYQRTMQDEDGKDINTLTYAFVGFDANGNVFTLDAWGDSLELPLLSMFKANKPYLKTSISFGGWTNAGQRMDTVFAAMAANPTARQAFVKSAVDAAVQAGVNGIDIDWEYVTSADAANYISLMQELRTAMNSRIKNPRLTTTAPASAANIDVFTPAQWGIIQNTVDRISVMAYDYFGAFSTTCDFQAPLKFSPNSPNRDSGFSVEATLANYASMGISKDKLVLGVPNYARAVVVAAPGQYAGLYQPVLQNQSVPGDFGDGIYGWDTLNKFLNKQPSALDKLGVKEWNYYDSTHPLCQDAQMSLLSGMLPDGNWVVLTFMDQASAKSRGEYITQQNLGGGMVWANYTEPKDRSQMITAALAEGMNTPQNQLNPEPSAPPADEELPPPSYRQATGSPPSYAEAMAKPTEVFFPPVQPANNFVDPNAKPPSYQEAVTFLERSFYTHMTELNNKCFGSEKADLMFELFKLRSNFKLMEKFIFEHRKELSEHRNIFKSAAVKLFGEKKMCTFFRPARSKELIDGLLYEAKDRAKAVRGLS